MKLFSIISLLVVIIMAVGGGFFFRDVAASDLVRMVEKNNASLAQGYINSVWKRYREVIIPLAANPAQMAGNPQVSTFAQETVDYFQKMPLTRVNIYSASGLLLLSYDVNQNDKMGGSAISPDAKFIASQLTRTDHVSQLLSDVPMQNGTHAKLVQTMIPIRLVDNANQPLEGVIELMYNVSAPWNELQSFQLVSTGAVILLFMIFLLMLSLTSKRAENIIARQYEANRELEAAAAAAQAENQAKSQFLANISHELRTPLNAIIGFSDIIKNEVMPKITERKYDEYINDIYSSGVHLLSLINDILDYSKAEAGKLPLEVSEVNANRMIQNCLRLVSPRAEAGEVKLLENLPKDQLVLITDSKKFKQVLLNLLSNAVKFTPAQGSVTVSGWANLVDGTVSFEVRDTGIGIAPKDISRAMSPFGQVDNTLKRKYEGTGLGLPLTKKFVELMGGKFNIESKPGKGTQITFTLPKEIQSRDGVTIKQDTDTETET